MCMEQYPGGRVSEQVSTAIKATSHVETINKVIRREFQKTYAYLLLLQGTCPDEGLLFCFILGR